MRKDAFYFPHFSNARQDRKLRRIQMELGVEGYGIYFMILEVLREQPEFRYPVQDIDLLADEFRTSEQKVEVVVKKYDLFQVDEDDMFFSPRFDEYLQPYLEAKERRKVGGIKGNLIKHKHITKEEAKEMTDAEILAFNENLRLSLATDPLPTRSASQSKVKESKGKESKLNTTLTSEATPSDDKRLMVDLVQSIDNDHADHNELLAARIWEDVDNMAPNNTTTQRAKVKTWTEPIRLMIERDNRTHREIYELWQWVQNDSFWKSNILSPSKLRDKFNDLKIKQGQTNGKKSISTKITETEQFLASYSR